MPSVSALSGMKFVSPSSSINKTLSVSAATAIKAAATVETNITPAVIVSISQAAQEATGQIESGAVSMTKLTPYSPKDITPELLSSVQKLLLDTYARQAQLSAYGSSTLDYSTRMSLAAVAKNQDVIKKYLVSPPTYANSIDLKVASLVHSAASSYLSLKETSANYENTKSYSHVDIGTQNTANEELLKSVLEKSTVLLKQEFNLSSRGLSVYDTKTLNYFMKYSSSVDSVRQALDKPPSDVNSMEFQFAVFVRQVAKGVVSDIRSRKGGRQTTIDKSAFDSLDGESFIETLKGLLTNDIDSFKKSIVKSLPSAESLKDAEMSYEFVRKTIDCGYDCVVETSQKNIDDPLDENYSGLVKLNNLISLAIEKMKSSILQVEKASQIDANLIDNDLWLSVTSNFVKTYGDNKANLGVGANKLAEVVVQESLQNSGFAKPIMEAMRNDRQKFNEISLNWGVQDAGIFWDIVQGLAQKQIDASYALKSVNSSQPTIVQQPDLNKTQTTVNSQISIVTPSTSNNSKVVAATTVNSSTTVIGVTKLSSQSSALKTLIAAASKVAILKTKI